MEAKGKKASFSTSGIAKIGIVASLYVALTLILGPFGSGAIQFRLSEMFNFLAFYHRRYIWAVTIGCAIANYFTYGLIDMLIGASSSLVFLSLGIGLTKKMEGKRWKCKKVSINLRFLVFSVFFSLSMITIAFMLHYIYGVPHLLLIWLTTGLGEFISLFIGMIMIEQVALRIDFTK